MHRSAAALVAVLLPLAAVPAVAQGVVPATDGFFLEPHVGASSLTLRVFDEEDSESGGTAGLRVGYGVTRNLALVADLSGAAYEVNGGNVGQGTLGLGLQVSFPLASPLVPYVHAGVTGTSVSFSEDDRFNDDDVTFTGGGLTLGVGARYHVSPGLALGVGLDGFGGRLTKVEVGNSSIDFSDLGIDDDPEYSSGRVRVALTWHPGR